MIKSRLCLCVFVLGMFAVTGYADDLQAVVPRVAKDDWPWWRGPNLDGKSLDRAVITKWGPKENVVWVSKVPGKGHSSPIVWGQRIFLTTGDDATQQQSVLALDRATGKLLWQTTAHEGKLPRKYPKNSQASATPACDGECVYSAFINGDGLHVTANKLDGAKVWQVQAGEFASLHGYGASPVLYKSLVIVTGDNVKSCYLTALDARTGKVVWRTERTVVGKYGNYGTPVLANVAGRMQLLLGGAGLTASYDPETGKLLWSCAGPAEVTANTPASNGKFVFSSGGFPEKELRAIRADGSGDVTKSHVAWNATKGVTYVPTPIYHDGLLFVVNDAGVATCFDADSGKQVWQERVQGLFSSSPVLVGDVIHVTSETGVTSIFKAKREFELVGTNAIQEAVMATPTICGGRIYLRTDKHLYCLGTK